MAIRVASAARAGWREGNLVFVVRSKADTADLLEALWPIGARLVELDDDEGGGPKFVSDPVVLPGGMAFWLDSPGVAPAMADRIVATIVEGLEARGIAGRLVGGGSLDLGRPSHLPRVALSAVPGHPPALDALAVIPWEDIARALDWVIDEKAKEAVVLSGGVRLDLPPAAARELVAFFHRSGRSYDVLVTGPDEWRECSVGHPAHRGRYSGLRCPHLSLARSGYAVAADVHAAFEEAIDRGRGVGAWAASVFVDVEPQPTSQVLVQPPWHHEPPGADAPLVLTDHVLDAFPWQRVRPEQVRSLPDPANPLLSYDPDVGELRMGRLDHWLREKATIRRTAFLDVMRATLGHALATRDVVWERHRSLPTSLPRTADDPLEELPTVDLDEVPVVSRTEPHPSLGVTPIELLSLRRGGPFNDALDISAPLRVWFRLLADGVAWQDAAGLRRVVDALVAADLGERRAATHRAVLATGVVRGLTPRFVEAAGIADAKGLRERLVTAARGSSIDVAAVLLDLLDTVEWGGSPRERSSSPESPAARTASALVDATARASATEPGGQVDAYLDVRRAVSSTEGGGAASSRERAHRLRDGALQVAGVNAFRASFRRAAVADPRVAHLWREAEQGPHRVHDLRFARAAAPALVEVDDPDAAWDTAVARAAAAVPGYWGPLEASLLERVPQAVVEAGWANARRTTARIHPLGRLAIDHAVTGAIAATICRLIAGQAAGAGWDGALRDLAWTATDDLCEEIAADTWTAPSRP